jgi:hypothetical protein
MPLGAVRTARGELVLGARGGVGRRPWRILKIYSSCRNVAQPFAFPLREACFFLSLPRRGASWDGCPQAPCDLTGGLGDFVKKSTARRSASRADSKAERRQGNQSGSQPSTTGQGNPPAGSDQGGEIKRPAVTPHWNGFGGAFSRKPRALHGACDRFSVPSPQQSGAGTQPKARTLEPSPGADAGCMAC